MVLHVVPTVLTTLQPAVAPEDVRSAELGLAEDPVGFGLQIIDLKQISATLFSTEPAEVETHQTGP